MAGLSETDVTEDVDEPHPVVEWLYLNQFKVKLLLVDLAVIALGFLIAMNFRNELGNVVGAMLIWFGILFGIAGFVLWGYIRYRAWKDDR